MSTKRVLFFIPLFFLIFITGNAIDFTSTSGTEYKNATVLKVMPDGIVISYVDSNGFEDIDHIKTPQLPEEIREKYNLSLSQAEAFDSQRDNYIEEVDSARAAKDKAYYAKQQQELKAYQDVQDHLATVGIEITFTSINSEDFGSIGYAYRYDDFNQDAPFGLICILGKSVEPQSQWVGKIYPLDKDINYTTPFPASGNVGNMMYGEGGPAGETGPVTQSNPNEGQQSSTQKIPCYADYDTALSYFQSQKKSTDGENQQ